MNKLTIGTVQLDTPLILAPLAGYSDLAFRLLCREHGAGLCVSEMISCHGLSFRQSKTLNMLISDPSEKPVSFQLFGADPEYMARAASITNDLQPDLIDINMGCPVKKVTKKGAGAALMSTPQLAAEIIQSVISNSGVPVTVKIRSGPHSGEINAVEFSKMAEDCGVSAITVHGRTWSQGFTGHADWGIIKEVKKNVSIPVIGNGDILSYNDAMKMMDLTGCDGVMIGRGALGNPWVFQKKGRPALLEEIMIGVNRHLQLMEKYFPVDRMLGSIKNHIGRYFKSMPGSSHMRKVVYSSTSFTDLKEKMASHSNKKSPAT